MSKPIINLDEVELSPWPEALAPKGATAERFGARMGRISSLLGAVKLGYNLTSVPPGKRAFPLHNHRVNEELFLILSGSGEVRIGEDAHPVREGDLIACPPGGPGTAHQLINTGEVELRYLAISTRETPEVAEYPDSGKFGVLAEFRSQDGEAEAFRFVGRRGDASDYWDGE